MSIYIVKPNQNLFDVALHLYGSIEGLYDILISNPGLNMNSELIYGQELIYHPEFIINKPIVDEMTKQTIVPSSGSRHVYYKQPSEDLLIIFGVSSETEHCSLRVSGEGKMTIDWGDNSPLETVSLTLENAQIEHYFDNEVEQRRIRIYGDTTTLQFTNLDTTGIDGALVVCKPITVDRFICTGMRHALTGLSLINGTYAVYLRQSLISDLLPLGDMSLQELDLTEAIFPSNEIIDDYLEYVVTHYSDRRPCTVRLSTEPGERGYLAMNTILNEPEWNIADSWKFYINNELYNFENGANS